MDDDRIAVVWHFRHDGRSADLSARPAYLISLSSQCSLVLLWAAAVLMTLQVECDKTELVSLQNQDSEKIL